MTEAHAKQAYQGITAPDDLPDEQRIAYTMLTMLYKQHREGMINKDTAADLKAALMRYPDCPVMEKLSLLAYFGGNVYAMEMSNKRAAELWELLQEAVKIGAKEI